IKPYIFSFKKNLFFYVDNLPMVFHVQSSFRPFPQVVVAAAIKVIDIISKSTDRRDKLEANTGTKFWANTKVRPYIV
ncbi:MAG: hypothetical protein QME25_06440, partial [Bacteroidota bacterium]|nr:hypothetical protein [Bacteroidota bacterium]